MKENKNERKSSAKIKRSILIRSVRFVLFFGLFATASFSAIFLYAYFIATPPASELTDKKIAETSIIYDKTGQHVLYEIYGEENREIIPENEMPDSIKAATIAIEDKSFYKHRGIDLFAIARSIQQNLKNDGFSQGGSTITQQLVRNRFFTRQKTIKRKFLEIVMAIKVEREFPKEAILQMYLNTVPYGSNAYGIETASLTFFGKHARELTLDEATLLASLPQAPSHYSPYGNNQNILLARQRSSLDAIEKLGLASIKTVTEARRADTLKKIIPLKRNIIAPHFVFHAIEELENRFGKDFLESGGYKIYTSLDYDKQLIAEKAVRDGAMKNKAYGASNAALVSLDPRNGEILAMVGSKDFFDESEDGQVNVTIRPRQPGSSFKPFVYAAAFEKGFQPENLVYDVSTDFGPDGSGKDYIPQNYDGKFHGLLSLRQTLAMSLNIPSVKILYLVGIDNAIDMAERLGISTLKDRERYGLSLVLGGGDVTLLEETAGFGVFANDGEKADIHSISKIVDKKQSTVFKFSDPAKRVVDSQVARKINSILSDNQARSGIFGSRSKLVIPEKTIAAKTGTTQEFRDAWTVGYTPSIATGVWTGNNDNRPMKTGADGVFVAAPIWNDFMTQVLKDHPREAFLDYDHSAAKNLARSDYQDLKVTYYNNKTGKFVSEKKAKKTDPKKIDVRVQYAAATISSGMPLHIEMQNTKDPVIQSWRKSIGDSYLEEFKN